MKKLVLLIIPILLAVLFVACENNNTDANSEAEKVTVAFNTNGAEEIPKRKVIKGLSVSPPTQPKKEGYIFDGWYLNNEQWIFSNGVTEDITLDAKWVPIKYTITYLRGEGTVTTYTIEDEIELPHVEEEDYIFLGWSPNENLTGTITKIEKGTTGNLTLYAKRVYMPLIYLEKEDGTYEVTGTRLNSDEKIDHLTFPKTYNGKAVTSIGEMAFSENSINVLDIPSSIEEIGSGAFMSTGLNSVRIEEGVKVIGEYAFSSNSYLSDVELPNSIEKIGSYAFNSCILVSKINIPKSLRELGYGAFAYCKNLSSSIEIPQGVTTIYDETFLNCEKIPSVKLHSGINRIEEKAFMYCLELSEIEIFNGTIGKMAFYGCEKLEKVTLNNGVTELLDASFAHCYALRKIVIPKSVLIVKYDAFEQSFTEIYAEAETKPTGWEIDAIWGYKPQ